MAGKLAFVSPRSMEPFPGGTGNGILPRCLIGLEASSIFLSEERARSPLSGQPGSQRRSNDLLLIFLVGWESSNLVTKEHGACFPANQEVVTHCPNQRAG